MTAALKLTTAHPGETIALSRKARLGEKVTWQVSDWEKPAANDCCIGEKPEAKVRCPSGQGLYAYVGGNPLSYIDPYGLNSATATAGAAAGTATCGPVCGVLGGLAGFGLGTWGTNEFWNWYNNKESDQKDKRPKDCPSGTKDIDKAKNKYGWDKDDLHGIKDGAHGGMGSGTSWTGITPDGTVGINEGGEWSPQGHWEDLR